MSLNEDQVLAFERRFWSEGVTVCDDHLDPAAVMAFPKVGPLDARAVRESLSDGPRWDSVDFHAVRFSRPDERLAVLAYTAEARRGDDPPYRALCTSTWRRCGPNWRIVQHQQTPL